MRSASAHSAVSSLLAGSVFKIIGEVEARRAVENSAVLLHQLDEFHLAEVPRALEHHVFEQVRKAGAVARLDAKADVVVDAHAKRSARCDPARAPRATRSAACSIPRGLCIQDWSPGLRRLACPSPVHEFRKKNRGDHRDPCSWLRFSLNAFFLHTHWIANAFRLLVGRNLPSDGPPNYPEQFEPPAGPLVKTHPVRKSFVNLAYLERRAGVSVYRTFLLGGLAGQQNRARGASPKQLLRDILCLPLALLEAVPGAAAREPHVAH